jgi:hypothetical protein
MRVLMPFLDELFDLRTQVIFGFKIHDSQALPLEDAEPLFDLSHRRPMHPCEVHNNARMLGEPLPDFFPVMRCSDVVAHQMNGMDAPAEFCVQRFQKGDESPLTLPFITVPIDLVRPGVRGGKEVEGAGALMLARAGWECSAAGLAGSGSDAGLAAEKYSLPQTTPPHPDVAGACRGQSARAAAEISSTIPSGMSSAPVRYNPTRIGCDPVDLSARRPGLPRG